MCIKENHTGVQILLRAQKGFFLQVQALFLSKDKYKERMSCPSLMALTPLVYVGVELREIKIKNTFWRRIDAGDNNGERAATNYGDVAAV